MGGSGDLRLRSDRLECCSSDFENSCCCTYYGEKRESGAALLPPTSLIAANKRDCLPDPCFLYTQGGRLHRHANLSAVVTGAQSPPRLSDTVRRGCTHAAGAVSKCVWQDPTGGGPPDWVLRGETPRSAVYLIGAAASAKIHAPIEKLPRAHTRCRGGRPLDMGDWYGVCVPRWLSLHP